MFICNSRLLNLERSKVKSLAWLEYDASLICCQKIDGVSLSFCSIYIVSMSCIIPPLPPLWKLDVTNSWICTFLQQNQHAPHHRWVQIWSEHTQNPSAAWWWIGILGTMFMHQATSPLENGSKLPLRQISGLGFQAMNCTSFLDPVCSGKLCWRSTMMSLISSD